MSLLRSIKNVANGYTATQVKVRNATANDTNSASTYDLQEICELTYNNQELFFIMDMIDKRLNDKGKNWRHVYKSLTLLTYLVEHGSENVVIWCNVKFYVIKSLREFQYQDESGKDHGHAIRSSAKELVSLLNNTERLKQVRRDARNSHKAGGSHRSGGGGTSRSARRFDDRYRQSSSDEFTRDGDRPSRYRHEQGSNRAGTTRTGGRSGGRGGTPEEEEDEIKRAIALSMQSAQEDEARRAQLRSASSEVINKAMNISQATGMQQQQQQTGLYTQEDWENYQRAQQEYQQYQAQLLQQQQLEQELAQQQQMLAQQQQEMATAYGQQFGQSGGQQQVSEQLGQHTGGYGYQQTSSGALQQQRTGDYPQPLQAVKTGSNNPFAMNATGQPNAQATGQQYQQSTAYGQSYGQQQTGGQAYSQQAYSQPSYGQVQQPQQYQNQQSSNNPFQQQYTGIATTQMQPSHTGFGFGNAGSQQQGHHSGGDSLIDL